MLGNELKEKRIKSGLTAKDLSKMLEVSESHIKKMEDGIYRINKKSEKKINNILNEEYNLFSTNKTFSRELFLNDMLTGNNVIDDIYINANWLKRLDGKTVYNRGRRKDNRFSKHNERVSKNDKRYVIFDTTLFYCKKEWLI